MEVEGLLVNEPGQSETALEHQSPESRKERAMKCRRLQLVLILLVVTTWSCGSCGLSGILGRGDGKPGNDRDESPAEATPMLDEDEQPVPTPASEGLTATTQPTPQYPFSIVAGGFELTAFAIIEVPDSSGMKNIRILFAQRGVLPQGDPGYTNPFAVDPAYPTRSEVILTTQEGYEYEGEFYLNLFGRAGWFSGLTYYYHEHEGANYATLKVAEETSGYVLHFTARYQSDELPPLPLDGVPVLRYEEDSAPDFDDPSGYRGIAQQVGAEHLFQPKPPESMLLSVGEAVGLSSNLEMTLLATEREGDSATITLLLHSLSGEGRLIPPELQLHLMQDGAIEYVGSVHLPIRYLGANEEFTEELELRIYPETTHILVKIELLDLSWESIGEYVVIVD
jgi:hypothetical protein